MSKNPGRNGVTLSIIETLAGENVDMESLEVKVEFNHVADFDPRINLDFKGKLLEKSSDNSKFATFIGNLKLGLLANLPIKKPTRDNCHLRIEGASATMVIYLDQTKFDLGFPRIALQMLEETIQTIKGLCS